MKSHSTAQFETVNAEMLSALLEDAATSFFIVDSNAKCTYFNHAAERLTGYSLEEGQDKPIQEVLKPHSSKATSISDYLLQRNHLGKNGAQQSQDTFIRKDGQHYDVLYHIKPLYQNGTISGAFLEVQDITEQKQTEIALRDSEAKFRRVLESNMIGILYWTTTGYIVDANNALLDMLGWTKEEMASGKLSWSAITPAEYSSLDAQAYNRLLQGETVIPYEKQYVHKDGHRIDILIRSALLEGSTELGLACILDITEQKAANKSLEQYMHKLSKSNKELEHFATIASHDLQEPLRKISLFSDHLKRISSNSLPEEALEDLERIQRSTNRMQRLIDDLLDLSRVSRQSQNFRKIDLHTITSEVLAELRYAFKDIHHRVHLSGTGTIEADPHQMNQMITQLIDNALKFHRPDQPSSVQIFIQPYQSDQCQIIVSDNGIGMKAEYFDKIFDTFVRLHSTEFTGTGIGLTLVQKIVERHNGAITVESVPGAGSTFTITLPVTHHADSTP